MSTGGWCLYKTTRARTLFFSASSFRKRISLCCAAMVISTLCVSFLSFRYETQKHSQVKSQKKGGKRGEREREDGALCPGKCQLPVSGPPAMGHSPRLLLFRQSTLLSLSLSLGSAIIIEPLSLLFFNSNIHFDTFLSFRKLLKIKKKRR